jgi:hypothetical protein
MEMPSLRRVLRAGDRFVSWMTPSRETPSYFCVMERGSLNGRAHLHGLVQATKDRIQLASDAHRQTEGFVAVRSVESIGGVSGYVTKYVLKTSEPRWWAGGPAFGEVVRVV